MLVYQRVQHTSDKFCIPLRSSTTLSSMHSPLEPVRNKLVATQMANRPLQQVVPSLLLVSPLLLLVSNQSNNLSKNIHIPQIKSNLEASSDSDFPKSQSFSIHWFHGYSMDTDGEAMDTDGEAMGSHRGALASILLGRRLWRRTSGALRGPVGSAWASQFLYRNVYLVFFCKRYIYIYSQFLY